MKLTEHIHYIKGAWGSGVWGANVFLLEDVDLTLVDTGFRGNTKRIGRELNSLGYSLSDIKNIIITHHHDDHFGSLAGLKEASKATVIAHSANAPYIEGHQPRPLPSRPRWLGKLMSPIIRLSPGTPVNVDMPVNDGDELPVLGGTRILHTPGHTPGSISLFIPQERALIVGDLLANRFGVSLPSRMFTVDIVQEIESIKRVATLDFDIICFGHGSPILEKGYEAVSDFARKLEKRYPLT